jgi:hypothetical protein
MTSGIPSSGGNNIIILADWRARKKSFGSAETLKPQKPVCRRAAALIASAKRDTSQYQAFVIGRPKTQPTAVLPPSTQTLLQQIAAAIVTAAKRQGASPGIVFALPYSLLQSRLVKHFESALDSYLKSLQKHLSQPTGNQKPVNVIPVVKTFVFGQDPGNATIDALILEFKNAGFSINLQNYSATLTGNGACYTPLFEEPAEVYTFPFILR